MHLLGSFKHLFPNKKQVHELSESCRLAAGLYDEGHALAQFSVSQPSMTFFLVFVFFLICHENVLEIVKDSFSLLNQNQLRR